MLHFFEWGELNISNQITSYFSQLSFCYLYIYQLLKSLGLCLCCGPVESVG